LAVLLPVFTLILGVIVGLLLGGSVGKDALTAWTALLFLATLASVLAGAEWNRRYQALVQQQLELEARRFADYVRPMLAWDGYLEIIGRRDYQTKWVILVKNVGRLPAVLKKITLTPEGGAATDCPCTYSRLDPLCVMMAAVVEERLRGDMLVEYGDDEGHSYELRDSVRNIVAKFHLRPAWTETRPHTS
jgi:hypothetical protein